MVLEMFHKNFKHLPWIESIEVARRTICGFDNQKSHFSDMICGFLETAQDFENKKIVLVEGLRNIPQKFQPSAINRKYRCGQANQLVLLILLAEVG